MAPPGPAAPASSPRLDVAVSSARARLVVRAKVRAGARGTLTARATIGGRALRLLRKEGPKRARSYRFAVRRAGRATVRVSFTGTGGWSSQTTTRRLRVRR